MVKPFRGIILMGIVFLLSGAMMILVPESGISVGFFKLQFTTWSEFWHWSGNRGSVSMDDFQNIYTLKKEDKDAAEQKRIKDLEFREQMRKFQTPSGDYSLFEPFFEAVQRISKEKRVRILHFGDSQIEGNRITGPIHQKFQAKYGGKGPGWVPVVETIPTSAVRQKQSDNWIKYAIYGKVNSAYHKRYGLLGAFNRFTEEKLFLESDLPKNDASGQSKLLLIPPDHAYKEKELAKAWFEVAPQSKSTVHVFNRVRLCFGNFSDTVSFKLQMDDQLIDQGIWLPTKDMVTKEWIFEQTPPSLRFSFEGSDSPDFYGISLETNHGVYVDNIAMRGSSGTIFNKMDLSALKKQVGEDHVAMIIMQFGGNSIPYIKSQKQIDDYQKWFAAQIRSLKKWFPSAVFLVIGPSDMATKVKDKFETYPFLPEMRDALKGAAFNEKAAFFDLYEAMGGKNSMVTWVNSEPPLASADYVHFAPSGSNKVANWLIEAFDHAEKNLKSRYK